MIHSLIKVYQINFIVQKVFTVKTQARVVISLREQDLDK